MKKLILLLKIVYTNKSGWSRTTYVNMDKFQTEYLMKKAGHKRINVLCC